MRVQALRESVPPKKAEQVVVERALVGGGPSRQRLRPLNHWRNGSCTALHKHSPDAEGEIANNPRFVKETQEGEQR